MQSALVPVQTSSVSQSPGRRSLQTVPAAAKRGVHVVLVPSQTSSTSQGFEADA